MQKELSEALERVSKALPKGWALRVIRKGSVFIVRLKIQSELKYMNALLEFGSTEELIGYLNQLVKEIRVQDLE